MNFFPYTAKLLCNIVWNPEASPWKACTVRVAPRNPWERGHPLVHSGKGFWRTDEIIVVGYVLKSDARIFRPIYHHARQKRLDSVLNMVKDRIGNGHGAVCDGVNLGGGPFVVRLRQNMARRTMLGLSLPVSIIGYIGSFV